MIRGKLSPMFADVIKVDRRETSALDPAAMVKRYGPWRCRMLAEKVETREEFMAAKKSGFLYFQGYFFRRPEVLTAHEIPANRLNYLRMLTAVSQAELDVRKIENLVKSEASLCYRLLRYLNSAAFGFANEIHSVRHALSILGEREVRRWIRLVAHARCWTRQDHRTGALGHGPRCAFVNWSRRKSRTGSPTCS